MTRWLLNERIPKWVLSPDHPDLGQPSRQCQVVGTFVIDQCPNCEQPGPMDGLILGPGNLWPNSVVICGDKGCGVFWSMIPAAPKETKWVEDEVSES